MENMSSNAQSTQYLQLKEKLSSIILTEMKKHKITGVSIAVVDDGKLVWSEGFGYSNKEERVVATPHTIYRIGSITKVFTATAIMQLVERGLLDLDQPVAEYLPGVYSENKICSIKTYNNPGSDDTPFRTSLR